MQKKSSLEAAQMDPHIHSRNGPGMGIKKLLKKLVRVSEMPQKLRNLRVSKKKWVSYYPLGVYIHKLPTNRPSRRYVKITCWPLKAVDREFVKTPRDDYKKPYFFLRPSNFLNLEAFLRPSRVS